MERLTQLAVLCAFFLASALAPGCKQQAPEKKASPKGADANPISPLPTPTPSSDDSDDDGGDDEDDDDPCKNDSSNDSEDDEDDEDDEDSDDDFELRSKTASRGLSLVDSVTYEDIESIIEKKCLTCHDTGGTSPILSTYSKVKNKASSIETEIDDSMPPSGSTKLTSTEKQKIRDWIADGKLEKPEADSSSDGSSSEDDEDDEDDDSSSSSDCDDDDDEDEDDDDDAGFDKDSAFKELLNPKKLTECHEDGKVYDRGKEKCHISSIAKSFDCSVDGIVKKFKASGITLKTSSGKLEGFEEYEVDQCGEYKDDPVVFFYKKVESTDDEVALSIKILCKKGSPACER